MALYVRDLVNSALVKLGVIEVGGTAVAEEAEVARQQLDRMLKAWSPRGYSIWATEASDLNDEIDITPAYHDAVIYGLASRLTDDFPAAAANAQKIIARAEEELRLAAAYDREESYYFR